MRKTIRIKTKISARENIDRNEKIGECFKRKNHFYLVREFDVLHVTDDTINLLYDNHITVCTKNFKEEFDKISRSQFNNALNSTIFTLNYFGKEYQI